MKGNDSRIYRNSTTLNSIVVIFITGFINDFQIEQTREERKFWEGVFGFYYVNICVRMYKHPLKTEIMYNYMYGWKRENDVYY